MPYSDNIEKLRVERKLVADILSLEPGTSLTLTFPQESEAKVFQERGKLYAVIRAGAKRGLINKFDFHIRKKEKKLIVYRDEKMSPELELVNGHN